MRRTIWGLLLVLAAPMLFGCLSGGPSPPPPGVVLPTRDAFTAAVKGKTANDVLVAVGKPDQTTASGDTQYWYYQERTVDPVSGNADREAQVIIENGKVDRINYR